MTINLNGREYPLRFSVNALCCLEEKTGVSFGQLCGRQLSCLRGLLWCGLTEAMPDLMLDEAGDMIDSHLKAGGELSVLSDQLAAALEDACFFHRQTAGSGTVVPSEPVIAV